mmetsp:Transcript_61014/g.144183  ORF Transcript_61014/g.144183 Transcript_61014/m.144183 type:complete len:81 (+) Transcript_61014:32-274(+)
MLMRVAAFLLASFQGQRLRVWVRRRSGGIFVSAFHTGSPFCVRRLKITFSSKYRRPQDMRCPDGGFGLLFASTNATQWPD